MARFDELESEMVPSPRRQYAGLGQRYKDMPPATFDQRFGPYPVGTEPTGIQQFLDQDKFRRTPGGVLPGTPRFADPSKVISQNLPPSLNSPQRQRVPLPRADDPSALATGAGTFPQPDYLQAIERMLRSQQGSQGILPGRAAGGPVEANQPYRVGERGPEDFVPLQVAQADVLPEGFKFIDDPKAPGVPVKQPEMLPEGFKFLETPAPQAPGPPPREPGTPQEEAQAAREAAAARLAQGAQPVMGRTEGAATRVIENFIPGLNEAARRAFKGAEFSDVGTDPTEALRMIGPVPVAGSVRGVAVEPFRAAQRATGVMDIPRAAEMGPTGQLIARGLSNVPGGGKIRQAAESASEQLQGAGTAAALRPTGEAIDQATAGAHVRQAITDSIAARPEQVISKKFHGLLKKSDEDIVGDLIKFAGEAKAGADIQALARVTRSVPADVRGEVQSAIISRLGHSTTTGEFDPATWAKAYNGLSERGKNILFGTKGGDIRNHLDSLTEVAERAPTWQQFERPRRPTLGQRAGPVAIVASTVGLGGVAGGPLGILGTVVPLRMLASSMAKPAAVASLARWSRAYESVIKSGGNPAAMASFKVATSNLSNNLNQGLTVDQFFTKPSESQE